MPKPKKKQQLDPLEETVIHMLSDGSGWVHTHGLDKHGLPELEMRGVPMFLAHDAVRLLNSISDYMLNSGNKIKAGETMQTQGRNIAFVEGKPVAAHDIDHYGETRLRVIDDPRMLGACADPQHDEKTLS